MRMSKAQIKQRQQYDRHSELQPPHDDLVDRWLEQRKEQLQQAKRKKLKPRKHRGHTR